MNDTDFIREIAEAHRQKLLDRCKKITNGAFSSGAAWSVHALDRIILACDGERDPYALGLKEKPREEVEQAPLFGLPPEQAPEGKCRRCWARKGHARGLCRQCHPTARDEGTLDDYQKPKYYTRDDLLDEWVMLCEEGYTRQQAAQRLGMKPESFIRAILRARRDGDPRAVRDHIERERAAS